MRHCRVDVVPSPIICTAYKPDPIVPEKNDVALAVTTKHHPFVAWTMTPLFLGDFGTVVSKRRPPSLGDRERLGGPAIFGHARVVTFDDVSCTTELIQFSVLPTASGDGEHQK